MYTTLVVYCILIALVSVFGGALPSLVRFSHRRIQLTLSLVSGVMLGVALLHLLPHSIARISVAQSMLWCLAGLLVMFFLIRMSQFHQHDIAVDTEHTHERKNLCEADRHHVHCDSHSGKVDLSWLGLCFGLAVHTLIDGVALAAACQAEMPAVNYLAGLGTFLAIALHKPLDAFSITSLMASRGWPLSRQLVVNLVFATMCPLGALLFAYSVDQWELWREATLGIALAISAGVFLCISLGDLLPELHFHSHDRGWLSLMLLLGVAIAIAIEYMPGHKH